MIKPVTFYSATCDCCGEGWYNDHYGWSAMNGEEEMRQMLYDDEWHVDGDKQYCPSCHRIDDDDNIVIGRKEATHE